MSLQAPIDGSFRDPSGHVYANSGSILRTVNETARVQYEAVRDSGILSELSLADRIVASEEVSGNDRPSGIPDSAYLLKHQRIPFISYPYEWSFEALKAAALHHLDLQLDLLERNFVLSDASSYNIQFIGPKPIFIDILSIRPYIDGEFWSGHRQFCQQFLNPLLLRSLLGVSHNAWFRGSLEGIPTSDLSRMLRLRHKFSWNVFSQVVLQARLEQSALNSPDSAIQRAKDSKRLSKLGYQGILRQLRNWIKRLHPADAGKTVWGEYAANNTYSDEEALLKKKAIREFAAKYQPGLLIDLGCNTGDFSISSLDGGAKSVIGFDFDQRAVDLAYSRSVTTNLAMLPLWLDAANPSPDQGWKQTERAGFASRAKVDAMIALAFEHHLAIGRNVPLPQVVKWLVEIAPVGIIEFVPKTDSTIQKMLALREDIFADYTEKSFADELSSCATIVQKQVVSESGRVLYTYDRRDNGSPQ